MLRVFLSSAFLLFSLSIASADPKVVVSIKPLHSLVAGVMENVGEPELLLNGTVSPHDYNLKPSQAQGLQDADLVIWVGEGLETFLIKPIGNLNSASKALEVTEIEGLTLHKFREIGEHNDHAKHDDHDDHDDHEDHAKHDDHDDHEDHAKHEEHEEHEEHAGHDGHNHDVDGSDPHVWLDIDNAIRITKNVAERLSTIDPENKTQYEKNASKVAEKLNSLKASISSKLQNASRKNYIVFHDAYQYFEKQFDLTVPTPVTIHPEIPLGAARIKELQGDIAEHEISCLFSEPQFSPKVIKVIAENTDAKISVLDPLGSEVEVGSNHYFEMMSNLANDFSECLKN
jgi:zinc transport system substrate-binding protein